MNKKPTVREFYRDLNNADAIPNIKGQVNFTADQMIWFSERTNTNETSDKHETEQLNTLGVIGRLSINDLEVFHYSLRIPKITERFFTEEMCGKLHNKLDEELTGIDYVNIEENGILVIGFRNMMITKKQEDTVVSVLNDL